MTIYTDGVRFTSDESLIELQAFAKSLKVDSKQLTVTRWGIYYMVRDAAQREQVKRAGARVVTNKDAICDKWNNRKAGTGGPKQ
jgi:hypothetical protein